MQPRMKPELRYLGVYIVANKNFKCDVHNAKIEFYRSLNGILGKVGTKTSISVTLSLVNSYANPVLLFGLETGCLNKTQIDKLSHTFNSIYMKLFSSFDKSVISLCQFYIGQLPLHFLLDLRYLQFMHTVL